MHPAVRPEGVQVLPPSIRRLAKTACNKDASVDIVWKVLHAFETREFTASQQMGFLPVCFNNLDSAQIPTYEQIKVWTRETSAKIERADATFSILLKLEGIPPEAGLCLWPRAWPWFLFFRTHYKHLPVTPPPSDLFHIQFLAFAEKFHDHPESYDLMLQTPGFLSMIAKIWKFLPDVKESSLLDPLLELLCSFMIDIRVDEPDNLAMLMDGAGGTLDGLAELVVAVLNTIIRRKREISALTVKCIRSVLYFVMQADQHPAKNLRRREWLKIPLGPLTETLLCHEIVPSLVGSIMHVNQGSPSDASTVLALDECFLLSARILRSTLGDAWVIDALDSGLLRAIVQCATLRPEGLTYIFDHLRVHLLDILPRALMYDETANAMKDALAGVEKLVCANAFRNSEVFAAWLSFVAIAEERFKILQFLENPVFKACDNLQCGEIREKGLFKRCSGCQTFYYCSKKCQISDWREGGHRSACVHMTASRVRNEFSFRQRAYWRAVIHHDYQQNFNAICAKQVRFMAANPTCKILVTVFDYATRPLEITAHSALDSSVAADLVDHYGAQWSDLVARATRSGGKMSLHVLQCWQGGYIRHFVVPLRSSSLELHQALQELASKVSTEQTSEAELLHDVSLLRDSIANMREIY
ncbi:hypothetical protein GGX14DRAFT_653671 [Mycena pura]|uniref:MYND-type domain-containing protein n=1 Tax=Mycena pura TaxID=153505 RepID=A0AAD6YCL3_9AGAR|nr:hypothetical protein GGX14DRAFT_653671 [Mycena pura]